MDCTVYGVKKSRTQLRDFHFHFDQALLRILRIKQNIKLSEGSV